MLGFGAEATTFCYVGLTTGFYLTDLDFIPIQFISCLFVIVVVGRTLAVYIAYSLFMCCSRKSENKLSCA